MRARVRHKARQIASNTVKRAAVLVEAVALVPALTSFIAKFYGERPGPVFVQTDSRSGVYRMFQLSAAMG